MARPKKPKYEYVEQLPQEHLHIGSHGRERTMPLSAGRSFLKYFLRQLTFSRVMIMV